MIKVKIIGLFVVLFGMMSFPEYKSAPFIKSQSCEMMENGDCVQKVIMIENRRLKAVNVGIDCGKENDKSRLTIPAGTRLEFFISFGAPIPIERQCALSDWYELN